MFGGRLIGAVVLVVMGALLVAGCGSSSDASSGVTKAEFIKEADAVCSERSKDWENTVSRFLKSLKPTYNRAEMREKLQVVLDADLIPMLAAELQALEELDKPKADEEKIEKMLQTRSRSIEKLEEGGYGAVEDSATFRPFEAEAKAYGLSCKL